MRIDPIPRHEEMEGLTPSREEALDQEGENQLQGSEARHQVWGDQLEGLVEGCEGQQTREGQDLLIINTAHYLT